MPNPKELLTVPEIHQKQIELINQKLKELTERKHQILKEQNQGRTTEPLFCETCGGLLTCVKCD